MIHENVVPCKHILSEKVILKERMKKMEKKKEKRKKDKELDNLK